jgi:predicted dinucleotide-binding enzyme
METQHSRTRARTASTRTEAATAAVLTTHGVVAAFAHPTPRHLADGWACADADPDLFFPDDDTALAAAQAVCRTCTFRDACLGLGTARGESGVWGGVLLVDGAPITSVPARGRPRKNAAA